MLIIRLKTTEIVTIRIQIQTVIKTRTILVTTTHKIEINRTILIETMARANTIIKITVRVKTEIILVKILTQTTILILTIHANAIWCGTTSQSTLTFKRKKLISMGMTGTITCLMLSQPKILSGAKTLWLTMAMKLKFQFIYAMNYLLS